MPPSSISTASLRLEWQALSRSAYHSSSRSLLKAKALLEKTITCHTFSCAEGGDKETAARESRTGAVADSGCTSSPVLFLLSKKKSSCSVWKTLRRHQVPWNECLQLLELQIAALKRNRRQKSYLEEAYRSNPSDIYRSVLTSWTLNVCPPDEGSLLPIYSELMNCETVIEFGKIVRAALQSRPALQGVLPVPFKVLDHFYALALPGSDSSSSPHLTRVSIAEAGMAVSSNVALLDSPLLSVRERERAALGFAGLCGHCGRWDDALAHLQSARHVVSAASRDAFARFVQQQAAVRRIIASSSVRFTTPPAASTAPTSRVSSNSVAFRRAPIDGRNRSGSAEDRVEDKCAALRAATHWLLALEMYQNAIRPSGHTLRRTSMTETGPLRDINVEHREKGMCGMVEGDDSPNHFADPRITAELFSSLVSREDLPLSTVPEAFLNLFAHLPGTAQSFAVLNAITKRIPRDHPRYVLMVSRAIQAVVGQKMYSGTFTRRCHTLLRRADWEAAIALMCGVRALDLALPVVPHVSRSTLLPPELYVYAAEVDAIKWEREEATRCESRGAAAGLVETFSTPSSGEKARSCWGEDGGEEAWEADPDAWLARVLARALFSTTPSTWRHTARRLRCIGPSEPPRETPFDQYRVSPRLLALLCARELNERNTPEGDTRPRTAEHQRDDESPVCTNHDDPPPFSNAELKALERRIDCFTFSTPEATQLVTRSAEAKKRHYFFSVIPKSLHSFHGWSMGDATPPPRSKYPLENGSECNTGPISSTEADNTRGAPHHSQTEERFIDRNTRETGSVTKAHLLETDVDVHLNPTKKEGRRAVLILSSVSAALRLQRWLLNHRCGSGVMGDAPVTRDVSRPAACRGDRPEEFGVVMQRRLAALYAGGYVLSDTFSHDQTNYGRLHTTFEGSTARPNEVPESYSWKRDEFTTELDQTNLEGSPLPNSHIGASSALAFAALTHAIRSKEGQALDANTIIGFYEKSALRPCDFVAPPVDVWGPVGAAVLEAYAIGRCWHKALKLFSEMNVAVREDNGLGAVAPSVPLSPPSSRSSANPSCCRSSHRPGGTAGQESLLPVRALHPLVLEAAVKALYGAPASVAVKVLERQIWGEHACSLALIMRDIVANRDTRALREALRRLTDQLTASRGSGRRLPHPDRRALRQRRRTLVGMAFALLHDLPALEAVVRACRQRRITPGDVDGFGFQRLLLAVEPKTAVQRLLEWRGTIEVQWLWTMMAHREMSPEDRAVIAALRPFDRGVQSILSCVGSMKKVERINLVEGKRTEEEEEEEVAALRACGEALRAMLSLVEHGIQCGTDAWLLPLTLLLQQFCEGQFQHCRRKSFDTSPSNARRTSESTNLLYARALFNRCSQSMPSIQRTMRKTKKYIIPLLLRPQHQTSAQARSQAPLLIAGFLHLHLSHLLQRPVSASMTSKLLSCCVSLSELDQEKKHSVSAAPDSGALSMPALFFFRALRFPNARERCWVLQAVSRHPSPAAAVLNCSRFARGHPELVVLLLHYPTVSWSEVRRLAASHLLGSYHGAVGERDVAEDTMGGRDEENTYNKDEEEEQERVIKQGKPEETRNVTDNHTASQVLLSVVEGEDEGLPAHCEESKLAKHERDGPTTASCRMNPDVWQNIIRDWGNESLRSKAALRFLKMAGYRSSDSSAHDAEKLVENNKPEISVETMVVMKKEDEKVADKMIQMLQEQI